MTAKTVVYPPFFLVHEANTGLSDHFVESLHVVFDAFDRVGRARPFIFDPLLTHLAPARLTVDLDDPGFPGGFDDLRFRKNPYG